MVRQFGIVKPSPELKSTCLKLTKNQIQGARAEAAVIFLLEKRGWALEFQRCRTRYSEIDLIFSRNNQVLLIEVKRLSNDWRAFERIQARQFHRLQQNLSLFSYHFIQLKVSAYVSWVDWDYKVSFVPVE